MKTLRVLPEAEAEIEASTVWYESKRAGLGAEFLAMLDEALEEIADAPLAVQLWREGAPWRRKVLRRFPYVIFLTVGSDLIEIVAVAHARRRPGYWVNRPQQSTPEPGG